MLENKRRETSAAVNIMKEKLKAMGILDETTAINTINELPNVPGKYVNNFQNDEMLYPPLPPSYDDIDRNFTNSNNNHVQGNEETSIDSLNQSQLKLKSAAEICRDSLRYLD